MSVVVIHASRNDRGGVMNASVSHTHGLIAAGVPAELWTGSPGAARTAERLGVPCFFLDALADPWTPLGRGAVWRRRSPAAAVLHQGARSWGWASVLWPSAVHAVRFPNYRVRDRRLFRNWIAVSKRHAQRLREEAAGGWRRRRVTSMKNGDAQSAATRPATRRAFMADGKLVFGSLGALSPRKGPDVLIDALALLRAQGVDAELRLGGPGKRRDALASQAERLGVAEHVALPGWVDAVAFLSSLDVFCLPSRAEPFGIVLLEAMSQGLPVIATETDGPVDILADGSGVLTPIDDPRAFADALAALARDPDRAAGLAAAARARARDDYGPAAVGQSLIDAFRFFGAEVIHAPRPSLATGE